MADHTTQQLRIDAPVDDIVSVVSDFDAYPQWAPDLKEVKVLQRDAAGRGVLVRFRAAAMGRSTTYTLCYDWSGLPDRVSWNLVTGDIMRTLDGVYAFAPSEEATVVTYDLSVEMSIPLPRFVKRRAQERVIGTALGSLRDRVVG